MIENGMSFWNRLKLPIIVLAPMADVTDASFRRMIARYSRHQRKDGSMGGPDIMWTEFVSADGLMRAHEEGKQKLLADLLYDESERPIVAQLFSSEPEYMEGAAKLALTLGFDGIDINMGCPDRGIERQGSGAAMIKDPVRARMVIRAAKKGAKSDEGGIPVSVKTRAGYNRETLEEWIPELLKETPSAITLHARTRKDMSKVPAQWEYVRKAVELRNEIHNDAWQKKTGKEKTLILGNGDVHSREDAYQKCEEYGADGAMLGRAIFGNPWLFHPSLDKTTLAITEKLRVMVEHTKLFEELLPHKNFPLMKKHFKAYIANFDGANELRQMLMDAKNAHDVEERVHRFLRDTPSFDIL